MIKYLCLMCDEAEGCCQGQVISAEYVRTNRANKVFLTHIKERFPGVLHQPMRDFRILKSVKKKRPVKC